ncbi:hypothetical protein LCGC14_0459020 [marine sediment metagenome]|uniref:Uncharacterized protein n=1 Tax=marine sediment metagenome TaxID=412755 RepID=A0A0F9VPB8_9ZZZZ
MKIFLASFLEPDNFGPGKVIGVANGSKPKDVKCDQVFPPLIPTNVIMERYSDMSLNDPGNAASEFVKSFTEQLAAFHDKVKLAADNSGQPTTEILPFVDGDTLASWERERFSNYRPLIAACLTKLGYEVVQR